MNPRPIFNHLHMNHIPGPMCFPLPTSPIKNQLQTSMAMDIGYQNWYLWSGFAICPWNIIFRVAKTHGTPTCFFFFGRKPIGSQRNNTFFFGKPKPGHQQQPTKTHRNNGTQIQPPRGLTFSSSNFHQGVIQRAREVGVSASQESCAALVQSHLREVGLVWLVGGKVGKGKGLKKRWGGWVKGG